MKLKILWIAGLMLAATAGRANADFVNGGFETGDLTGWTASSLVTVTNSYSTFTAVEGNQFALLSSGLGENESPLYTTLSQIFAASTGNVISGSAFFATTDTVDFNDDGYVKIIENGTVLFSASVSSVGGGGQTPWTDFSYTFTSSSNYTIEAGVRNVKDNNIESVLGLDNLHLSSSPVPEPASIAMWGLGALGMMFARRKRQQKKLAA